MCRIIKYHDFIGSVVSFSLVFFEPDRLERFGIEIGMHDVMNWIKRGKDLVRMALGNDMVDLAAFHFSDFLDFNPPTANGDSQPSPMEAQPLTDNGMGCWLGNRHGIEIALPDLFPAMTDRRARKRPNPCAQNENPWGSAQGPLTYPDTLVIEPIPRRNRSAPSTHRVRRSAWDTGEET